MPTWSDIQLWNSEALSSYAETLNSRKQTIDQQVATLENRQNSFQGEGQTADALRSAMGTAHAALRGISEQMQELRGAVTKTVSSVEHVRSLVHAAQSAAAARGCMIGDNGIPFSPRPPQSGEPDKSSEVTPLVRRALQEAEWVDEAFCGLLTMEGLNASSAKYSNKGVHTLSAVQQEAFKNMPPEQRAQYWSQLTPEQKRFLCDTYPDLIGNAEGVEAWARDRANRRRLPKLKQAAETEKAKLEQDIANAGDNTALKADLEERLTKVKAQLNAYKSIETALNLQDGATQCQEYRSLLTLDVENGRVLAAVAQGDVDHAKNVATVVPGIGTTVEGSLQNEIKRGANLRSAAVAEGNIDSKDVALVSWLGYEAPPKFSLDMDDLNKITTPNLADKGSDKLAGFLTGLNASRKYGAGDAHMTLLGHSYGSTTSGMAATKVKPGVVDDITLFGSPGMGTYDPSEIHVPEGHRFVSGVPGGDFVQGAGDKRFDLYSVLSAGNPAVFVGLMLSGDANGIGYLGMNPMDPESGFTHISDDATGSKKYTPWGVPSEWLSPDGRNHSVYMDPGTETLRDMGRIVAGGNPKP